MNSRISLSAAFAALLRAAGLLGVGFYRSIGTAFLGGSCRFEPSCSKYAEQALLLHKPLHAFNLIGRRLCKCRPGGPLGFDPVPESEI
jgi:uncharacterized protein